MNENKGVEDFDNVSARLTAEFQALGAQLKADFKALGDQIDANHDELSAKLGKILAHLEAQP